MLAREHRRSEPPARPGSAVTARSSRAPRASAHAGAENVPTGASKHSVPNRYGRYPLRQGLDKGAPAASSRPTRTGGMPFRDITGTVNNTAGQRPTQKAKPSLSLQMSATSGVAPSASLSYRGPLVLPPREAPPPLSTLPASSDPYPMDVDREERVSQCPRCDRTWALPEPQCGLCTGCGAIVEIVERRAEASRASARLSGASLEQEAAAFEQAISAVKLALEARQLDSAWTSALAASLRSLFSHAALSAQGLQGLQGLQEILRTHRWTGSQFSSPPDRSALLADLARRLRSLDQERMAREEDSRAPLAGVARPSMAPSALHLQAPMELDPLPQLQPLGEDAGATAGHPRAVQDDPATNSVAEYKEDIIQKNFREEGGGMPQANYMDRLSPDINGRMRAILIDWLIEVHTKYNLRSETLFLTRNLIDRYLSRMPTTRRRLQLVGVVSMFVAAKFEEVDPPTARSFAYITDNAYTVDMIFKMECAMLAALGFKIVVPTEAHFLDFLLSELGCEELQCQLVRYVVELSLVDLHMIRYEPSHLVAAAVLLSNELLGRRPVWTSTMARVSRHTEQALRTCVGELRSLVDAAERSNLQAVRKKYSVEKHLRVAKMAFHRA